MQRARRPRSYASDVPLVAPLQAPRHPAGGVLKVAAAAAHGGSGSRMGCAGSKGGSPVADDSAAVMRARRGARASIVSTQYKVETVKDAGAVEAQRLVASTGSLPLHLPAAGLHLRYAFLSQRGYYPDSPDKANQDAVRAAEGLGGNAGAAARGVVEDRSVWGWAWRRTPTQPAA